MKKPIPITRCICLLVVALLPACSQRMPANDNGLWVSILPLREIVTSITGDDFPVEVLVPPGASPETFEPTPRQFAALGKAKLIFGVGLLEFENNLLSKTEHPERIVDLSRGIVPIAGSCRHGATVCGHSHGVDPHIWTSPRELQVMAGNAYRAIHAAYPDSVKYTRNYERLQKRLEDLDRQIAARIDASRIPYFLIYHPALTYYARAYGIRQEAIEDEGKEPSARRLSELIGRARRDGIRRILYQTQFPASSVEVIARDIGAQATAIDPLAADITDNLLTITDLITESR